MKQTIEHERTTTSTVRQLRNDLKDEKIDHEDKVWGQREGFCGQMLFLVPSCLKPEA